MRQLLIDTLQSVYPRAEATIKLFTQNTFASSWRLSSQLLSLHVTRIDLHSEEDLNYFQLLKPWALAPLQLVF